MDAVRDGPATWLGSTVPDKLASAKLTGSGRFVGDSRVDGALSARILHSDLTHADISALDLTPALTMPGILAAVVRSDIGLGSRVGQYGDMIAAVAAESDDIAREALGAITYQLDPLPAFHDTASALAQPLSQLDGAAYDDPGRGGSKVEGAVVFEDEVAFGAVEQGFTDSALVLEGEYRTGRPVHANLSRHCCIATLLSDGRVDIETSIDGPYYARRELANQLGLEPERLIVRVPELLTSSFGAHSTVNPLLEPVAVALALKTGGRPVRLEFDSDEEFVLGHTRHPVQVKIKSGVREDGVILALDVDLVADHGAYPNYISRVVVSNFRDRVGELVRLENYRFRGRVVATNNTSASEMRGIGSTQLMYCLGAHLDEVAARLGIDPVEFYQRNALRVGETALTTGNTIKSTGLVECLRRGAERIGWSDRPHSEQLASGRRRGLGVGIGTHTTGLGHEGKDTSRAIVRLEADGSVQLLLGAPDSGQGGNTIYSQILAEGLGLAYDQITVGKSDTITSPKDMWGTVASRGAFLVGAAVGDAASNTKQKVVEAAAVMLETPPEALVVGGGEVKTADASRSVTLADVIASLSPSEIEGVAQSSENPPTYGAYFAEVEVDVDTGVVEVTRVVAALDVGFALNPQLCRGQVEGAVMMGLEMALFTNLELENGYPGNASFLSLRLATTRDLPKLETILVEATEPTGPYGVKGIGTPSITPAAPAIANAVSAAIGRRVEELPIRPEWIVGIETTA